MMQDLSRQLRELQDSLYEESTKAQRAQANAEQKGRQLIKQQQDFAVLRKDTAWNVQHAQQAQRTADEAKRASQTELGSVQQALQAAQLESQQAKTDITQAQQEKRTAQAEAEKAHQALAASQQAQQALVLPLVMARQMHTTLQASRQVCMVQKRALQAARKAHQAAEEAQQQTATECEFNSSSGRLHMSILTSLSLSLLWSIGISVRICNLVHLVSCWFCCCHHYYRHGHHYALRQSTISFAVDWVGHTDCGNRKRPSTHQKCV